MITLLLLFFSATVFGNDTASMGTASNIRFVTNNKIVIHREDLTIGLKDATFAGNVPIVVEYEMENTSDSAETIQMAFPIPGCNFNDFLGFTVDERVSDANTCIKEPKMNIWVDGKPTQGRWVNRYLVAGRGFDESALSKGANVKSKDLDALLALMPQFIEQTISKEVEKQNLIFIKTIDELCKKMGKNANTFDCQPMKRIWAEKLFIWSHQFPPKTKVRIRHEYLVEASWNIDWRKRFKTDVFCLSDPSVLKAWRKHDKIAAPYLHHSYVGYILKTGGNWSGPIREFNLTIKKTDQRQLISTCFSGLKKTGLLEFKVSLKNFVPKEDLYILFFYAKELGKMKGNEWIPDKDVIQ
ncbi:MAG: DUF4424 family protein [Bdellovibrio sp.]|nr:DUF4424 family protein [Bdellovibrio sp.]